MGNIKYNMIIINNNITFTNKRKETLLCCM